MSDDQCDEAGGCGCDHGQEANVWQTRSLVAAGILTSGALVADWGNLGPEILVKALSAVAVVLGG